MNYLSLFCRSSSSFPDSSGSCFFSGLFRRLSPHVRSCLLLLLSKDHTSKQLFMTPWMRNLRLVLANIVSLSQLSGNSDESLWEKKTPLQSPDYFLIQQVAMNPCRKVFVFITLTAGTHHPCVRGYR